MWLDNLFKGVLDVGTVPSVTFYNFIICIGVALALGLFISLVYIYKSKYTKSFVVTLATLPAVVCMIIMMVSGNLGAGVAVAGTFSLVRFRSVPGTAKEIGAIFLAMGAGLVTGMGYLGYAILFVTIVNVVNIIYNTSNIGEPKINQRTMRITIPEDLDYTGIFDDLFTRYTYKCELQSVKTTNMGSLFKRTYDLILKNVNEEKELIDELRCRNGNLEINLAKQSSLADEL